MDRKNNLRVFTAEFPKERGRKYDIFTFSGKSSYLVVTVDWTQSGKRSTLVLIFRE